MKNDLISEKSIGHKFDSFCKKALKNELIDIERKIKHSREFQVLFCELPEAKLESFFSHDLYFIECYEFEVEGFKVYIVDDLLGKSISSLSELRQRIILLSYFIGYNDKEISIIIGLSHDTVWYQRNKGIKELRKILEGK